MDAEYLNSRPHNCLSIFYERKAPGTDEVDGEEEKRGPFGGMKWNIYTYQIDWCTLYGSCIQLRTWHRALPLERANNERKSSTVYRLTVHKGLEVKIQGYLAKKDPGE